MKKLVLAILLVFPILAFGQKIKKNEIDDFTDARYIETSWERLNMGNGMTGRNHLYFRLRNVDNNYSLDLKWVTDDFLIVDEGAKILVLQKDKTVNELESKGREVAEKGGGSINIQMSAIRGMPLTCDGDFDFLGETDNPVSKLRINTTSGYIDIAIKEGNAKKLNKAYKLVEEALKKEPKKK